MLLDRPPFSRAEPAPLKIFGSFVNPLTFPPFVGQRLLRQIRAFEHALNRLRRPVVVKIEIDMADRPYISFGPLVLPHASRALSAHGNVHLTLIRIFRAGIAEALLG